MPSSPPRLSRSDWIDAALGALAERGLAGVAVEPLATQLGVTKGSFYAHFSSRDELLSDALDRWVTTHGQPMLERLQHVSEPTARLQELFDSALAFAQSDQPSIHVRLLRDAHDELVRSALQRVDDERVGWLATVFRELHHDPETAQRRAQIAYATYIGLLQTTRNGTRSPLGRRDARMLTADLVRMLQQPAPAS